MISAVSEARNLMTFPSRLITFQSRLTTFQSRPIAFESRPTTFPSRRITFPSRLIASPSKLTWPFPAGLRPLPANFHGLFQQACTFPPAESPDSDGSSKTKKTVGKPRAQPVRGTVGGQNLEKRTERRCWESSAMSSGEVGEWRCPRPPISMLGFAPVSPNLCPSGDDLGWWCTQH